MEKINIAELLKDCPKGMELDCAMFDNVTLSAVIDNRDNLFPIKIDIGVNRYRYLTKTGGYDIVPESKCVIFPKGKTTWEGFVPPCKFKDGDIITSREFGDICIFKGEGEIKGTVDFYCGVAFCNLNKLLIKNIKKPKTHFGNISKYDFASKQDKQKLFQAIKDNGYQWNAETKTLEKLVKPQFNVGDWIIRNNKYTGIPVKVIEFNGYYSCELNGEIVNLTRNDVHNNFHLWTINDAKDGDVLFHSDSASNGIFIFKEILQCGTIEKVVCHCDYDSEDGFCLGENHTCCWTDSKILYPATKKRCDLLFKKIKEAGYKWNPETKVLEKITQPKFKDGDIIADEHGNIAIYKGTMWYNKKLAGYYCGYRKSDNRFLPEPKRDGHFGLIEELHHATEEEKEKLFQVILDNRYSWNTETKKLEKLFPYNIGTKVWVKSDKEHKYIHTIVGISRNACGNLEYEVKEEKTGIFVHYPKELLIPITTKEPQFKIGDIIQDKDGYKVKITEVNIEDECYGYESMIVKGIGGIAFKEQNDWKLVPNKFDINTLIPFESKVLVRHNKDNKWCGSFFSFIDRDIHSHCYNFVTTANKSYPMMIPYKGNEYLLGKVEDCKDFYKIWE